MDALRLFQYFYDKQIICQLIITILTYLTLRFVLFLRNRQQRFKILGYYGIPGPKPSLLGGNLDTFLSNNGDNFYKADVEFQKIYGKVFGYFLGDAPVVVITDMNMLKAIFLEDKDKAMTERQHIFIETPVIHSVLFAKYSRWRVMRKILSPHFAKYALRGQSSSEFIEDTMRLMFGYIEGKFKSPGSDETSRIEIEIFKLMKSTTLHLISSMAVRLPEFEIKDDDKNVESLDEYLSMCDKGILIWAIKMPIIKSFLQVLANKFENNKTMKLVRESLKKTIEDGLRRLKDGQGLEQQQVIDLMIELNHKGLMSKNEVTGNAEALLLAGYDTTATTLSYIFWVLAKYPDIQEKLRCEVIAHGIESKYLVQVINETMRLYPVVTTFISRIAMKTIEVGCWTIPAGARITYNAWVINHDPDNWEEPWMFDPERFAEGKIIHPCAFAPFGLGERKCLGFQLAMLELKMITCDMLLHYRLFLKTPDVLELTNCAGVLTKPKEKIILQLEKFHHA